MSATTLNYLPTHTVCNVHDAKLHSHAHMRWMPVQNDYNLEARTLRYVRKVFNARPTRAGISIYDNHTALTHYSTQTADPSNFKYTAVPLFTASNTLIRNHNSIFPAPPPHASSVLSRLHTCLRACFSHTVTLIRQTSLPMTKAGSSRRGFAKRLHQTL